MFLPNIKIIDDEIHLNKSILDFWHSKGLFYIMSRDFIGVIINAIIIWTHSTNEQLVMGDVFEYYMDFIFYPLFPSTEEVTMVSGSVGKFP